MNFNITQIVIFIIKMIFLNFFKEFMFSMIKRLEQNYKLTNLHNLLFYTGILYEKLSCLLNNYLII